MFGDLFLITAAVAVISASWATVVYIPEDRIFTVPFAIFGTTWITVTAVPLIQSLLR